MTLASPPAQALRCPSSTEKKYEMELKIETPPARLHEDRSVRELGRAFAHGAPGRVLGMANTSLEFGWSVRFESEPYQGLYCLWVSRLELTISHLSPDIFVARDYNNGSCAYRVILAHEQAHIRTSRATINRFIPRLRMTLTSLRIPTGLRPKLVDSQAQAEEEVRELMKELVEPVYDEISRALHKAQAKLDSPSSYRRLFSKCSDW